MVTGDPDEVAGPAENAQARLGSAGPSPPRTDGIALMEEIPELTDLPVIFISAYGRDETVVRALDAGAADYIVSRSPRRNSRRAYGPRCAGARGRSRSCSVNSPSATIFRRVALAGRPVRMTPTEYELLRVLSMNAGRVLTHESLLRQAWADGTRARSTPNSSVPS